MSQKTRRTCYYQHKNTLSPGNALKATSNNHTTKQAIINGLPIEARGNKPERRFHTSRRCLMPLPPSHTRILYRSPVI